MQLSDEIRNLIASVPIGHLTTINLDGSPQASVVWVGLDGDDFVIGHMAAHKKVRNVQRDDRVVRSMLAPGLDESGLRRYLVVNGTARVTEGGAVALLQRLAEIHLGPGVEYPPEPLRTQPGYVTRITPTRLGGHGPWAAQ